MNSKFIINNNKIILEFGGGGEGEGGGRGGEAQGGDDQSPFSSACLSPSTTESRITA